MSFLAVAALLALPTEALPREPATYLGDLRFRLTVDLEELRVGTVEIEGVTYRTFDFPEAHHLRGVEVEGLPDLPFFDVTALLPEGMQVASIDTLHTSVVTLNGEYLPAPIQPEPDPRNPRPPAAPDPEVYGSLSPYPRHTGDEVLDGSMRGFFLGSGRICPLRFYGRQRRMQVLTEIEFEIRVEPFDVATRGPLRNRSTLRSRYSIQQEERRWIEGRVSNPRDLEPLYSAQQGRSTGGAEQTPYGGFLPTERPSEAGPPVAYVIITNNETIDDVAVGDMVSEFQRLADWKTQKGVPAVVRTVDWIHEEYDGADRQEEIRNFIIDAYELWGTDWVLLGGDVEIVPERVFGGIGDALTAAVYYGGLDGNWNANGDEAYSYEPSGQADPLWDVWVGRLPADSAGDVEHLIDKLFSYERVPGFVTAIPGGAFYQRFLALAGATNSSGWNANSGFFLAEDIILNMAVPAGLNPLRIYEEVLNPADTTCMRDVKRQLFSPGGVPIFTAWGGGDAQDALKDGQGFVYHMEHSTSEFLGGPSRFGDTSCLAVGVRGQAVITSDADALENGPGFSIVVSGGSITNAHNLDSISERFLLNPQGGAVAYVGKSSQFQNNATGVDTMFFKETLVNEFDRVGQALAFATQEVSTETNARAAALWTLLGDPEMASWTDEPAALAIDIEPDELESAAPTHIIVSVSDSSSAAPIENALVALKQDTDAYAYKTTDASGIAEFDFYPTNVDSAIIVTATARNHIPKQVDLEFAAKPSGPPWVVYESHETTEVTGNHQNGLEAGEQWKVAVEVRNIGADSSPVTSAKLRPLGAVTMTLRIDGVYDPEAIFIGRFSAHPPQGFADTCFTLPTAEWNGVSAFGRPALLDSSVTGFFVWRDTTGVIGPGVPGQDWRVIFKQTAGGSSTFTGTIAAPGEFSSTRAGGFEADDSLWAGGEVTTFKTFSASSDPDTLLFNARNTKWVAMVDSVAEYSTVDPGETASGVDGDTFEFVLKPRLPDRMDLIFELVTDWFQFISSGSATSEFLLHTSSPAPEERLQVVSLPGGLSNPPPIDLKPTIWNAGTGRADSVVAWLTPTSVGVVMLTSKLSLGPMAPGELKAPTTGFRFNLGNDDPDTAAARFRLDLTNHFANGETLRVFSRTNINLVRPAVKPKVLSLDPQPNGIWVIWDSTGSTLPDLRGYNVYVDGDRVNARQIERTRRAFVPDLDPETSYDFFVALEDSSGNESLHPAGGTSQSTAWPFAEEWPKRMDSHALGNMQPTVADVDGDGRLEAFVGGINVFAWHLDDGSEVIDGDDDPETDGVFYVTPDSAWSTVIGRAWGAPFAIADLDSTPDGVFKEIIGVTTPAFDEENSVLYVLKRDGSVDWTYQLPDRALPYAAPVVVDLDQDGEGKEILLLANDGAPAGGSLYIWDDDGSAYGASVRFITGLPLPLSNSLAVADLHSSSGLEIAVGRSDGLVQVFRSDAASNLWTVTPPANCGGSAYRSSTPVIGNIDASTEELELAVILADDYVASGTPLLPPRVYVMRADSDSLRLLCSWSAGVCQSATNRLSYAIELGGERHLAPVAIGNMDEDENLEIFLAALRDSVQTDANSIRSHGYVLDLVSGPNLAGIGVPDSIPRSSESQPLLSTLPFGQPIIANIDADEAIEGMYSTLGGGIFGVEMAGRPNAGWPTQVGESVVGTPVIGDLSGRGKTDLVFLDRGGTLHLLQSEEEVGQIEWGQFGGDPGHSFVYQGGESKQRKTLSVAESRLERNAPNPFNPSTRLRFYIPARGPANLRIYDVSGRLVRVLADQALEAGMHEVIWDGRDQRGRAVSSGTYLCDLQFGGRRTTQKMLLVK